MRTLQSGTPASLGRRIGARVVDVALLVAVDVGLGLAVGFGFGWLAAGTVIVFGYFVLGDALAGATVGKRVLGLEVRGPDGRAPSLRQSAIREAFTVLGSIPFVGPLLALVAWIAIASGIRSGEGVHDRLAGGTRVVVR